jgi:hypothetical protein
MPPSSGWTLREATVALCPQEAALHRNGGKQLLSALRSDAGELAFLYCEDDSEVNHPWEVEHRKLTADHWLATQLLAVLRLRPDLQLTGYDLTKEDHTALYRLPYALLVSSAQKNYRTGENHVYVDLCFDRDSFSLQFSFPEMRPNLPPDRNITGARIMAAHRDAAEVPLSRRKPPAAHANTSLGRAPTPDEIRRWQQWRYDNWPAGRLEPTSEQCQAAAEAHFGCHIPREPFIDIRNSIVPYPWRKPGPRRLKDSELVATSNTLKNKRF